MSIATDPETIVRPTKKLRQAQLQSRPASEILSPMELGSSRITRHSFSRSFIRAAARGRWQVVREKFDIDGLGRGTAVYRVDADDHVFRFVVFSTVLEEDQRTDRVIAEAWDVTAALVEGDVSSERLEAMRGQVPLQEEGRADDATLVWTRANRSARHFDYVIDRLARAEQPEIEVVGDSGYLLRSTAFYGNGKWGLVDYDWYSDDHPLGFPYRAQILAAWLLRELSYDLVEHCARTRSDSAVKLDGTWRRFFGLGNATGLGLVPYIINHPRVFDAWVAARELPLSHALAAESQPDSASTLRAETLLRRASEYFAERSGIKSAPYLPYSEIADQLERVLGVVAEYRATGTILGKQTRRLARELHDFAAELGAEARQVVDSVFVELHDEVDDDVERIFRVDERARPALSQNCATLLARLESDYAWTNEFDFDTAESSHYFWYSSVESEEPRRGVRGETPGEQAEFPVGIARAVQALMADLARFDGESTLAEFLLAHPSQRGWVDRVQTLAGVPYGEAHANLLGRDFLPLDLQRFQLAIYGMDNYSPQSTDWLRVTLFGGAPRVSDVAEGIDDDWLFSLQPKGEAA